MIHDWATPTPAMMAAVRTARFASQTGGLNQVQLAEWIMMAPESLWYLQAGQWAEQAPREVSEQAASMFQKGCGYVVQIVDLGYDEAANRWWNVRALWPTDHDWVEPQLVLMDLGVMLKRLPNVASFPEGTTKEEIALGTIQRGFPIVSAGFGVFLSIILGPRWEQRYEAVLRGMREARRMRRRRV